MPTPQQLQKLDKYVDTIYEFLTDQFTGLRANSERQITVNRTIFARMLGQLLYDAPNLHTGMVSIRLIEQKLKDPKIKPTVEHHHGRQNGGEALLQLVDRAIYMDRELTREEVVEVVVQHCHVHYTTAEENAALRKHQKQCSSEAAYRRANVVLIEAAELFHNIGRQTDEWRKRMQAKYQPMIDEYYNPTFVETTFTLTLPTIIN